MEMKLEVIVLPVAHVDHANAFYRSAAFREDIDYALGDDIRVVQFTPPGSEASIVLGNRLSPAYEVPGPDPAGRDYASVARFCDPDGNGWVIQEVKGVRRAADVLRAIRDRRRSFVIGRDDSAE